MPRITARIILIDPEDYSDSFLGELTPEIKSIFSWGYRIEFDELPEASSILVTLTFLIADVTVSCPLVTALALKVYVILPSTLLSYVYPVI